GLGIIIISRMAHKNNSRPPTSHLALYQTPTGGFGISPLSVSALGSQNPAVRVGPFFQGPKAESAISVFFKDYRVRCGTVQQRGKITDPDASPGIEYPDIPDLVQGHLPG